ncbi:MULTISPECIES: NF038132 family protein [Thalassotalea]|uniref:Ice-binding protein C-terminal domain-containing protein n=2 Tax=Thalassotalea TaxID=1518149 RepID=A0A7X0NHG3_9GAMM|nr:MULTISPECIES: NF038132 family protein [Thalassotalea]MBB6543535.1 hypothetical protein [Thalassotalea piscium]GHE96380.1 hypothetical protein GCM10011501_27560 [Thalassotalea profundi]
MNIKKIASLKVVGAVFATALLSSAANASMIFDSGIPSGWSCTGNCGTSGADGDITSSPIGGNYGWVSTENGEYNTNLSIGTDETTGTILQSSLFSANANDDLNFFFNYVTSDGAGFSDYAWARLLDSSFNQVAMLFTARTLETGTIVPGLDMPLPEATLTPGSVDIISGAPTWSPLGGSSGDCWDSGCGYTGWVESNFKIASAGNFYLEFGVTNWNDEDFQSGLAFDGITVGGVVVGEPPVSVPETGTLALFGLALVGLLRRKK